MIELALNNILEFFEATQVLGNITIEIHYKKRKWNPLKVNNSNMRSDNIV